MSEQAWRRDLEERWRAQRAALADAHDEGAAAALIGALDGNADVKCMAYCYGGSPDIDVYEVLADLAQVGWRLTRVPAAEEPTP